MIRRTQTLLMACAAAIIAFPAAAADIRINGRSIPEDEVRIAVAERIAAGAPDSDALRNAVREQLITRELFAQEARKAKLDKSADTATRQRMAREEVLARQYQAHYLAQHAPADAQVRATYEGIKQRAGDKEFHVRQIFVATEDDAKAAITRLNAGEKFDALAQALSRDEGSRSKGGDLGWLTPLQLQPHVIGAVTALQAGQVSAPVKGQSGWHVIRVDDVRPFVLPAFEQLAPQIRRDLGRRTLEQHLAELRKKASTQ